MKSHERGVSFTVFCRGSHKSEEIPENTIFKGPKGCKKKCVGTDLKFNLKNWPDAEYFLDKQKIHFFKSANGNQAKIQLKSRQTVPSNYTCGLNVIGVVFFVPLCRKLC